VRSRSGRILIRTADLPDDGVGDFLARAAAAAAAATALPSAGTSRYVDVL
jgi:hypothetical protein